MKNDQTRVHFVVSKSIPVIELGMRQARIEVLNENFFIALLK